MRFLVGFFILTQTSVSLFAENVHEPSLFLEANQAYQNGKYEAAISHYKGLLKNKQSSGIHFNLANAYFKNDMLGYAIHHYKKAKRLAPRDPDIEFNLEYAQNKVLDRVDAKSGFGANLLAYMSLLNEREAWFLLFLSAFLLTLSGSLLLFIKKDWLFWLRRMFMVLFAVSIVIVIKLSFFHPTSGVVVSQEAKVYSSTGTDSIHLFTLHEGVEFKWDETTTDWIRIELADGKKGWVKRKGVVF